MKINPLIIVAMNLSSPGRLKILNLAAVLIVLGSAVSAVLQIGSILLRWQVILLLAVFVGLQFSLPVVGWLRIRSAESRERRPIVEIDLCVGPKKLRARVNLNDRSQVQYPFLLGRNILKENFVVDCMKEYCNPPSCPDLPQK